MLLYQSIRTAVVASALVVACVYLCIACRKDQKTDHAIALIKALLKP